MRKNRYKIDKSTLEQISVFKKIESEIYRLSILLEDYFKMINGQNKLLQIMDIVYEDIHSEKTTYMKKPGQFKTDMQIEKGFEYCPVEGISIIQFFERYDFFFVNLRCVFLNKNDFEILKEFIKQNFHKMKFNYEKDKK